MWVDKKRGGRRLCVLPVVVVEIRQAKHGRKLRDLGRGQGCGGVDVRFAFCKGLRGEATLC